MYAMAPDDLGVRIRRARERLNMSQQQVADAVSRSVRAVGSWERGEAVPKNAIGALEQVLHTDLTSDKEPDPNVLEIRELGERTKLTQAEQDQWIALYEARKSPRDGAQRAG